MLEMADLNPCENIVNTFVDYMYSCDLLLSDIVNRIPRRLYSSFEQNHALFGHVIWPKSNLDNDNEQEYISK